MVQPTSRMNGLVTLTCAEILHIYDVLVRDFADTEDPLGPPLVRQAVLESAVGRQMSGSAESLKYPHPLANAATLTFGICCNHPFLNGNKRTALVAMLAHLDRNDYCLPGVSQNELYDLMTAIAGHTIHDVLRKPPKRHFTGTADSDYEVECLWTWLRAHAKKLDRLERPITYRQLRQILQRFGISIEISDSNQVDIVRYREERRGLIFKKSVTVRDKLGSIGYHNDGTQLTKSQMKKIREMCGLTESQGCDSHSFYTFGEVVDSFVNNYRRVLRRLAKT